MKVLETLENQLIFLGLCADATIVAKPKILRPIGVNLLVLVILVIIIFIPVFGFFMDNMDEPLKCLFPFVVVTGATDLYVSITSFGYENGKVKNIIKIIRKTVNEGRFPVRIFLY